MATTHSPPPENVFISALIKIKRDAVRDALAPIITQVESSTLLTWTEDINTITSRYKALSGPLKSTWSTYGNGSKTWTVALSKILRDFRYRDLLRALGFNPLKITKTTLIETHEITQVIWEDNSTQQRLIGFVKTTAIAQKHSH